MPKCHGNKEIRSIFEINPIPDTAKVDKNLN